MTGSGNDQATRRKRMPRAERERQMLAVAERIFAERGYVAASMDEIADRVGVSKPMLYEYFGSKEGLLLGAIREARGDLRLRTEQAVRGAATMEEALRRGLVAFFEFITSHRQAWSLLRTETALMSSSAGAEVERTRRQQTGLTTELLRGFGPHIDEQTLEAAAEIVLGACERLAVWCERHEGITPEQAADYVMQLTWFGMAHLVEP